MHTAIVSFWMSNIPGPVVTEQANVVGIMKAPNQTFLQFNSQVRHGPAIDVFLDMNEKGAFKMNDKEVYFDTIILLDIDAIPLDMTVLSYMESRAREGVLIGNVQRSNHIENNQHLFAAPSCMAFTTGLWKRAGKPSFAETSRSDVAEEFTFLVEELGDVEVEFGNAISYDMSPVECPIWNLKDGMQGYGRATTFEYKNGGKVFHQFQIWDKASQESFVNKCKGVLNGIRKEA